MAHFRKDRCHWPGRASSFSGQDFRGGNGPGTHRSITKADPSSGRWHRPTRCGDRNTSMVELLKLVIDILVFVGKNFIFQETTLFFRKQLYFSSTSDFLPIPQCRKDTVNADCGRDKSSAQFSLVGHSFTLK